MATKLSEIPIPPGFSADQADFYRRGYRDGETGAQLQDMKGYPHALALAYAHGGMDGALQALPPSADELTQAYSKAGLRRIGVSYQTAITSPLLRKSLDGMVLAARRAKRAESFHHAKEIAHAL